MGELFSVGAQFGEKMERRRRRVVFIQLLPLRFVTPPVVASRSPRRRWYELIPFERHVRKPVECSMRSFFTYLKPSHVSNSWVNRVQFTSLTI